MLASTVLAVMVAERVLKAWDRHRVGRLVDYPGTWRKGGLGPGGYLQEGFAGEVIGEDGRLVRWRNNAQGLRYDRDLSPAPPAGKRRVLVIGDSFAGGYRTDQDETFAARAEAELRRRGCDVEMPVAVIEEPVTGLYWLQQHGLRFAPDVLLLTVCLGNDIAQTFVSLHERGRYALDLAGPATITAREPADPIGFHHGLEGLELPEHALAEGGPRQVRAPFRLRLLRPFLGDPRRALRPGYGGAQPHKLFDPGTAFGFCLRAPPAEIEQAFAQLARTLEGYQRVCARAGIAFAVLLAPQPYQVQAIDWQLAVSTYGLRADAFALDRPQATIRAGCSARGILCIDPTGRMRAVHDATHEELYFPGGDMHWLSAGHRVVAEVVVEELQAMLR